MTGRITMTVFRIFPLGLLLSAALSLNATTTSYGKLPMSFEANRGQSDKRVKFIARGAGYQLFLTPTEAVLSLSSPSPAVVRMRLQGSNRRAQLTGLDLQQNKSNYFIGGDPAQWRRDVPNYARVKYTDVYPGIDLFFYGNQRQLEYDFVVGPGVSPDRIEFTFDGVRKLSLDSSGNLVLDTLNGAVVQHAPVIYQDIRGERKTVNGRYRLIAKHRVGFQVEAYDTTEPLRIDPVLAYSSYLGGSSNDIGRAIAVDSAGNAYVTGETLSTNFPGAGAGTQVGTYDVFVAKLNAAGSALVYSTYVGGSNSDYGYAIAVGADGSAYVTGQTNSLAAPGSTAFPTVSAIQGLFHGGGDTFIFKLNAAGSALVYSTYYGGSGTERGEGIAVDAAGYAYTTGTTSSHLSPCTANCFPVLSAYQPDNAAPGSTDAYVARLNAAGSLVYSTFLGGTGNDYSSDHGGIAINSNGDAYVTGTAGGIFPGTGTSLIQSTYGGGSSDAFVAAFNASGALLFATYLGGGDADTGAGIALDGNSNAYVTGTTRSINFPTVFPPFQAVRGGVQTSSAQDAFVSKIDPLGMTLLYSTYLGGDGGDNGHEVAVDASGNAHISGWTTSTTTFPTVDAIQALNGGSGGDAFVTKFNSTGGALVYSTFLGANTGIEHAWSIALDNAGSAYVTGETNSTNFPRVGAVQTTYGGGGSDAFVAKIAGQVPIAPAGFVATATASTTVELSWTAVTGATGYQIDRVAIGGLIQISVLPSNSFSDTSASPNEAYLYRLRAVNETGVSANSSDLATTVMFTNVLPVAGMVIKAVDLSELRTAVDAVVSLSGSTATFTGPATPGTTISALNVTELRSQLQSARAALGLSTSGYTDAALAGVIVKAIHFRELRLGVQ